MWRRRSRVVVRVGLWDAAHLLDLGVQEEVGASVTGVAVQVGAWVREGVGHQASETGVVVPATWAHVGDLTCQHHDAEYLHPHPGAYFSYCSLCRKYAILSYV